MKAGRGLPFLQRQLLRVIVCVHEMALYSETDSGSPHHFQSFSSLSLTSSEFQEPKHSGHIHRAFGGQMTTVQRLEASFFLAIGHFPVEGAVNIRVARLLVLGNKRFCCFDNTCYLCCQG